MSSLIGGKNTNPVQDLLDPVKWGWKELIMVGSQYEPLYQKPLKHAMNLSTLQM